MTHFISRNRTRRCLTAIAVGLALAGASAATASATPARNPKEAAARAAAVRVGETNARHAAEALRAAGTRARTAAAPVPSTSFSWTSEEGDYIGGGGSGTLTNITVTGSRDHLSISGRDDTDGSWSVQLSPGRGDVLRPGRFAGVERDPFRTGRAPGLSVSSPGRGCNEVWGSFTVDQIGFDEDGRPTLADISVVQRCESSTAPAFRGTIHLNQLPLSYRQVSEPGDWVGGGQTVSFRGSTSLFGLSGNARGISFQVEGQRVDYSVRFTAPAGENLTVGRTYTADRFGENGQAVLDASGDGRGCNESTGTFRITTLVLDAAGDVTNLRATFEQYCDGSTAPLRGTIRYFA